MRILTASIVVCLFAAFGWGCGTELPAPRPRVTGFPDVLLIVVDDLNVRLGCYGDSKARTPFIDSLAQQGVQFDAAFCQVPLCNPSRASFLTGLRPTKTKVWTNHTSAERLVQGVTTLPHAFAEAGYETVRVGKVFHTIQDGQRWRDRDHWTRVHYKDDHSFLPPAARRKLKGVKVDRSQALRAPLRYGPSGREDLQEDDGIVTELAVRELQERGKSPLFLAVGLTATHLPYSAPDRYFREDEDASEAVSKEEVATWSSRYALEDHESLTPEWRAGLTQGYYACAEFVDRQVGRLMEALGTSGRSDRTVVVLVSDHGMHLGEQGQWRKATLLEPAVRIPLLISGPGVVPGSGCERVIELLDLYPTLLDLCGLPGADRLDGRSLVPLLSDPGREWDSAAVSSIFGTPSAHSVRTEQWRLTRWSDGVDELFDVRLDPGQRVNLARDQAYRDILSDLARHLP